MKFTCEMGHKPEHAKTNANSTDGVQGHIIAWTASRHH